MVEKLTEQNLQLEENLQELQDEKADLVRTSHCDCKNPKTFYRKNCCYHQKICISGKMAEH